jgi:hypothetical protein
MAGIIANAVCAKAALTAATRLTLIQVTAPANQRVKILGWSVFFDEVVGNATPANPVLVSAGKQSGGTASALTPIKKVVAAETLQTTAKSIFSVAATTTVMESKVVNSQTGYEVILPMGQEIILAGGELFGIDVTPGATVSTGGLNAMANITFEE